MTITIPIPPNPDYEEAARWIFEKAAFVNHLGARLFDITPGSCRAFLPIQPPLLQQNGFVHAGVQATLADHTAGTAAATLVEKNEFILSAEFKINLLRPASGIYLLGHATVLKPGRKLIVVESNLYTTTQREETWPAEQHLTFVAKATVTLIVLEKAAFPITQNP